MSPFTVGPLVDFNDLNFHGMMLSNGEKYLAFAKALRPLVQGRVVAEVGAGVGVLSFIAAELGARRVLAVEQSVEPTSIMKDLLPEYPKAMRAIGVLCGSHREFVQELKFADIVFSETIGYFGFEEGISMILSELHRHSPGAYFLPLAMSVDAHPLVHAGRSVSKLCLARAPIPSFPAKALVSPSEFSPLWRHEHIPELNYSWCLHQDVTVVGFMTSFECKLNSSITITNRVGFWPRARVLFRNPLPLHKGDIFKLQLRISPDGRLTIRYGTDLHEELAIQLSPGNTELLDVSYETETVTSLGAKVRRIVEQVR
ncbi:MAG TPA: hypothetical protein VKX28_11260 [Xanthobacteraceae bacterium]|nr:hypothetical protein [Xanthobacteraceae bacterium]